jgi:DNA polymerase I-like protein with 3'-5' exonuclease and polymerase domains/uracil-DNA glycosylase
MATKTSTRSRRGRASLLNLGDDPLGMFDGALEEPPGRVLVDFRTAGLPDHGPNFAFQARCRAVAQPPLPDCRGLKTEEKTALRAVYQKQLEHWQNDHYEAALRALYWDALYTRGFTMNVLVKGVPVAAQFVSGTSYDDDPDDPQQYGPRPAEVLVLGKMPGNEEIQEQKNFVGPTSDALFRALGELGIARIRRQQNLNGKVSVCGEDITNFSGKGGTKHWYFTNANKFTALDRSTSALSPAWLKDSAFLLHQELRIVRPRFILCLGAEAARALLGEKASVQRMFGRVVEIDIPLHLKGEPGHYCRAQVMCCVHPAYAHRKPEAYPDLVNGLGAFWQLVQGARTADRETDICHSCLYTERDLACAVDGILAQSTGSDVIAVDCEWHGDMPADKESYLRTIQFSHREKHAYCVVLRHQGNELAFRPGLEAAKAQLRRLLIGTGGRKVRLGGHFFRADLPWLCHFLGDDVREGYRVADTPEATKIAGGWDTGYMAHAIQEAMEGGFKLENLAARYVGIPRYDVDLQNWKDWYIHSRKLKDAELEGYGQCPDEVLHPYALYDVDATIRLFHRFNGGFQQDGLLDRDIFGNSGRTAFWHAHRAAPAALDMELNGVLIDRERGDALTQTFIDCYGERLQEFQARVDWPGFNPNSVYHCRELLFGEARNGTRDHATGGRRRLRPPGVATLDLMPIKAAGTKGKLWDRVIQDREQEEMNPSTDKETLGILSHRDDDTGTIVGLLRDLRFLSQVLKGQLRRPYEDDGGDVIRDEDGKLIYDGGLLYWVQSDDRVHTHFYPVETGRWSSSRPNCHNISKRREDDYRRMLGPRYEYPLRSMICAREGCVLVEADYKSAELNVLGWMAQDAVMIERCRRNALPESHPDFIDLHALMAVEAFGLDCAPTKKGLESIGRLSLRVAAKNILFGIPYGRSADAIARQCREEGNPVELAVAQHLVDFYHKTYAGISSFLRECELRSQVPGWLASAFLRYRRFVRSSDPGVIAEQQRQATNFPIQSAVADMVNLACGELYDFRAAHAGDQTFDFLLQIHDALLFEVQEQHVEWFTQEVLPECMTHRVPFWPRQLDGTPIPIDEPYHLAIETEIYTHWGEKKKAA